MVLLLGLGAPSEENSVLAAAFCAREKDLLAVSSSKERGFPNQASWFSIRVLLHTGGPLMEESTIALFCCLHDFAQMFSDWEHHKLIPSDRQRRRAGILSLAEMLLIMVLFHTSPYKTFKDFWFYGLQDKYRPYFNELPSYERFVALMPRLLLPSYLLVHWFSGERSGIYFVDSTKLAVCHNARGRHHKVFRRMAQWGRSSMGWFFGLKLHLVINNQGQIMAVRITAANVHDRHPLAALTAGLQGKVFGDKGYISKEMMHQLWQRGLHLITGIRRDMKNHLMPLMDKLLLRKRFIIETLFHKLKSHMTRIMDKDAWVRRQHLSRDNPSRDK